MGCVENLESRLGHLNKKELKAFKDNKRISGFWKMLFYLIIPPYRNYNCDIITNNCRTGRGWVSRIEKSLKYVFSMGKKDIYIYIINFGIGLEFRIHKNILDQNSDYFDKSISETIKRYSNERNISLETLFIQKDFCNQEFLYRISDELHISSKRLSILMKTSKKKKLSNDVLDNKE